MRFKKLLALVVLAICTLNTYAQEEDYTSRITNANMASKDGWTLSATGGNWSDVKGSSPSFVIEAYAGWGSLELTAYSITQTVTLPSGKYRAEGYAFYRCGGGATDKPAVSNAYLIAGDFSAKVVTLGGETLDETLTAYPNSMDEASAAFTKGYYKSEVEFALESESDIEFGYKGTHTESKCWFICGPIKLYRVGDFDYSLYEAKLAAAVADAEALYNVKMSASILADLKKAVTDNFKSYTSVAEYNTASDNIRAAIASAEISINSYKVIEAGVVPDNSLDGWVCENTNTFHINTWSGEGNSDGSNMKTPFIENWVGKGSFLGAGKVYYQLAGLEPGEIYYAQALVRSYNEASADAPNGPNFFINDTKVDMATEGTTFTYNNMSGIYATLGGAAVVGEDGKLTLGVEIAEDRNYNWVAFKSVSIMPMEKAFAKALETAKSYLDVDMSIVVKNKLNTTIQTYEGATINTVEGYENAIAALTAATEEAMQSAEYDKAILGMSDLMESTNVYTAEAYNTYKGIFDTAVEKHNAGTLTGVVFNPYAKNTKGNKAIDYDDLLLSAWAIGGEQCKDYDKALYINTWSNEGDNDGTNFKVPFFEYWVSDANSLGEKALTATLNEIPEGKYEVTAWVRVRAKNNTAVADATGITLQVNEGEAVDVTKGEQVGTSQFNIGEFNASGEVLDGTLTIQFAVAADNNISWLSFKNVKYTRIGDATAINEVAKKATAKTIFNVAGQQIKSLQKGLNIVDGKKVYVK